MDRRGFLRSSAFLTAGVFTAGAASPCLYNCFADEISKQAPSDRLRCGCIGVGSMGRGDAWEFSGITDIVAICDVDSEYGLAQTINSKLGRKKDGQLIAPDTYDDYRRVLDRDDIDLVSIGTPDHWHTKIAIEAMQAGKHVFCQKPLTLTLEENILIRKAAEKYGKVFQVGTQQRSQRNQFMAAALLVRGGYLGTIKKVVCIIDEGRQSGPIPTVAAPESLNWEVWQGQAPVRPYMKTNDTRFYSAYNCGQSRGHLNFRWWFDYSGGKITDWGAHHVDSALWALDRDHIGQGPVSVDGTDSTFICPYKDGHPTVDNIYSTPIRFDVVCRFADGLEFHLVSNDPNGNGILFEGTNGRIHVNRERIKGKVVEDGVVKTFTDSQYTELNNGNPLEGHKRNLVRCIRQGGEPIANVSSNVQGMHICHLANLACRLQREIRWDPVAEQIIGDDQAAAFFRRDQRKGYELPEV